MGIIPHLKRPLRNILRKPLNPDGVSGGSAAIPLSLSQLLFPGNQSPYYTDAEWPNNSHRLKDYSQGVGDLRNKRPGYCYNFDGVNDYIALPDDLGLSGSQSRTFCLWVKTLSTPEAFISCGPNYTGQRFSILCTSSKLRVEIQGSGFTSSLANINDGEWHFIGVALNGSTLGDLTLYVDATSQQGTGANVINTQTGFNWVGWHPSRFSTSKISDLFIYDTALTSSQVEFIRTHGAAGDSPRVSNLVAHYPMQEEAGTIAYDISGNGNHGTHFYTTPSTFHAIDSGVAKSYPNDEGYRLSSGVYIPKRVTDNLAADGNALTVTGRCPNYGLIKDYAWQGDGAAVYVVLGSQALPSSDGFTLTIPIKPTTVGSNRAFIAQRPTSSAVSGRCQLFQTAGNSLIWQIGATAICSFTIPQLDKWYEIKITRIGHNYEMFVDGTSVSTGSDSSTLLVNTTSLLGSSNGGFLQPGQVGPVTITTASETVVYATIPGTRNVTKIVNGTATVIPNAVVGGTLETLHSLGDGAWRSPAVEYGANWDGTGLQPGVTPPNVTANKAPITLELDRTGGTLSPADYITNRDGYTSEEFDDVPSDNTVNKRLVETNASDRYGSSSVDISNNPYFEA